METQLDLYLSFPLSSWQEEDYAELHKACGSVEDIEENFDIEFSCGDGKYLSDLWAWSESGDSLKAKVADEELLKYDGNVCTDHPPRDRQTGTAFKLNKSYRFTIKYSEKTEEAIFYLGGKERSRKWVG
jgi:hypothetical protein